MSLVPSIKSTYYFVENNVILVNTGDWDKGRGDCLGRTALGFIAYKWSPMLNRLHDFYEKKDYIQVYRTPEKSDKTVSRDHVSYLIIAFAYAENHVHVKNLVNNLPWKLSERFNQTIDLWLWMHGLVNKWYSYLFTTLEFFQLLAVLPWNKLLYLIMGAKERHQRDWTIDIKRDRTELQKRLSKLLYPEYAVHNLAWQMYIMKRKPFLCRKLALAICGKYNYLVRVLLGGKVTWGEVEDYKSMSCYRWSTRLDETNDRHVVFLKPQEANDLEKDLLVEMWCEQYKK